MAITLRACSINFSSARGEGKGSLIATNNSVELHVGTDGKSPVFNTSTLISGAFVSDSDSDHKGQV